jgi:hypothetical protein
MLRILFASAAVTVTLAFCAHSQATSDAPAAGSGATAAADLAAPDTAREGWRLDEGWTRLDLDSVSADSLVGSDIRNLDGEAVAKLDDLLLTEDGKVESVLARFGGFLGFGESTVLLTPDEIDVVEDAAGRVMMRTNLTEDALKARPGYDG